MHLKFRGVNDAFESLVRGIDQKLIYTVKSPSRVGDVMQIPEPVIITFSNPKERVLFNKARDANPFFHLYEALWMLAGRNDIAPLKYYSEKYPEFVDDGDGIANGAYGYRWRKVSDGYNADTGREDYVDQLQIIINHLKAVPTSRRVVLQMWNVQDDLYKIGPENQSKDVCCNTAAYFSLRAETLMRDKEEVLDRKYLDMTVTNRSNDLILGTLGANIVHFSILQEYIANSLGVEVGVYNQFSNNLHAYTSRWYPDKWLADGDKTHNYGAQNWNHTPMVKNREVFDEEVKAFIDNNWAKETQGLDREIYEEPFLETVAKPMCNAFHCHKTRDYWGALNKGIAQVAAGDWQLAGYNWVEKRRLNWENKTSGKGEYGDE